MMGRAAARIAGGVEPDDGRQDAQDRQRRERPDHGAAAVPGSRRRLFLRREGLGGVKQGAWRPPANVRRFHLVGVRAAVISAAERNRSAGILAQAPLDGPGQVGIHLGTDRP